MFLNLTLGFALVVDLLVVATAILLRPQAGHHGPDVGTRDMVAMGVGNLVSQIRWAMGMYPTPQNLPCFVMRRAAASADPLRLLPPPLIVPAEDVEICHLSFGLRCHLQAV